MKLAGGYFGQWHERKPAQVQLRVWNGKLIGFQHHIIKQQDVYVYGARLLGTAAAVVFGGGMTLAVVVYTWIKAPTMRKLEYN